jgi:hypothetical protein
MCRFEDMCLQAIPGWIIQNYETCGLHSYAFSRIPHADQFCVSIILFSVGVCTRNNTTSKRKRYYYHVYRDKHIYVAVDVQLCDVVCAQTKTHTHIITCYIHIVWILSNYIEHK